MGYSPWGRKESDTTVRLILSLVTFRMSFPLFFLLCMILFVYSSKGENILHSLLSLFQRALLKETKHFDNGIMKKCTIVDPDILGTY